MQVASAWRLQRSPDILLIPGTSSLVCLRENLAAAALQLPAAAIARLDEICNESTAVHAWVCWRTSGSLSGARAR